MATKMKKPQKLVGKSLDDAKQQQSKVEKEILELTGEKPQGEKETWGEYVERLTVALSNEKTVPEEKYDELSPETQAWFKEAADLVNDGKEDRVKPFSQDAEEKESTVDEKEEKPAKGEDKKSKRGKKPESKEKKEEPKKKDDFDKKGKEKKERGAPTKSGSAVARIALCEKLGEMSLEELKAEVKKRGAKITDSQLHAVHNITKRTISTLLHVGVKLTAPK